MADGGGPFRSIFELGDVFDYRSPFRSDWIQNEREARQHRQFAKDREFMVAKQLGNAAASESKVSITVPLLTPAPKGKITMSDFIDLVRQEEEKYPDDEQRDTKLMVTRLRKIFYNTPGWNQFLIPKAAAIQPPYSEYVWRVRKKTRVEPFGLLNNFDLVDKEYYPIDLTGKKPSIYTNAEVMIDTGSTAGAFIDMGHVFAGWDAFNNPDSVVAPLLSEIKINRNWDATTWLGDLGSVLAEAWVIYVNGEQPLKAATLQHLIDEYAPAQDMLGNIDSYVLSIHRFTGKVSEILELYYTEQDPRKLQRRRFEFFAQEIGIGPLAQGSFVNSRTRSEMHIDEISDAAALYIAAGADPPNTFTQLKARSGILSTAADHLTASVLYEAMIKSLTEAVNR